MVVIVFLSLQGPIVAIQYINKFKRKELSDDWNDALDLFECFLRTLKLPLDFYIFYMYMCQLRFFLWMKQQRLERRCLKLNRCHKFSFAIAYVLGVLGIYAIVIQLFYLYMKVLYYSNQDDVLKIGHDVERKIVWPITDFYMALAILYLFYQFGLTRI
jgi:hypothetical protein